MNMTIKKAILILTTLVMLCGLAGCDSSKTSDENGDLSSNVKLNIINNGTEIVMGDDSFAFLEQIEAIIEKECTDQAVLSRLLSDSEINSYKHCGLFVSVNYEIAREYKIGENLDPRSINGICVLISEEMPNYIVYYPTVGICKVFSLSKESSDIIMAFLE